MSRGRGLWDGGEPGEGGWMGVVRASGGAYGRGRRDLGQGSWVDLRLFYPQFSADSHLLGENKVNRNPLWYL